MKKERALPPKMLLLNLAYKKRRKNQRKTEKGNHGSEF